jgi:hypothetical protein
MQTRDEVAAKGQGPKKAAVGGLGWSPNPVRGWIQMIGEGREGVRDTLKLRADRGYEHLNGLRQQVSQTKTDLGGRVGESWDADMQDQG